MCITKGSSLQEAKEHGSAVNAVSLNLIADAVYSQSVMCSSPASSEVTRLAAVTAVISNAMVAQLAHALEPEVYSSGNEDQPTSQEVSKIADEIAANVRKTPAAMDVESTSLALPSSGIILKPGEAPAIAQMEAATVF
jgi:hypothetical protein